jgi:hypothetical protein
MITAEFPKAKITNAIGPINAPAAINFSLSNYSMY